MMWWVSFLAGIFVGAFVGIMLLALIIAAGDDYHGRR